MFLSRHNLTSIHLLFVPQKNISRRLKRLKRLSVFFGVTFANDLILKITSLPYYKIGFNLIDMIESLQVKVSTVKHVVSPCS